MSGSSNKSYTGAPDPFRSSAPLNTAKLETPCLNAFITYAHEDKNAKNELQTCLAVMKRRKGLVVWEDSQITPGGRARQEDILEKVADSDLLLYLVSAKSLESPNCNIEFKAALERDIKIIPIILEHCDWIAHELSDFEVLPDKGKPINDWEPRSKGWQDVVDGIREVVNEIEARGNQSPETFEKYQRAQEYFHRGNIFLADQRRKEASEQAIEFYSKAIDSYPNHYGAYRNRGEVYRKIGEPDKALQDYNEAIRINPDFAAAYNNRGIVYSDQGNLEQALVEYNKALERDPNLPEAYNNRGEVYRKMDEHDKAFQDYNKSIELEPNEPESYIGLSTIYRDKEEYEKAIENCNRAIELDRSYVTAYNNRGIIYRRMGEFENAIEDYRMAIQLDPEYVRAYYNRGVVYHQIGQYEKAIKDYNEAIKRCPEYRLAYYSRGITLLSQQKWKEAKSDLTTAKDKGWDIVTAFREDFGSIEEFERIVGVPLRIDIALLLEILEPKAAVELAINEYIKAIELKHGYMELSVSEFVRQAILELEYPHDGIRVVHATETLAEQFGLSDDQKAAKNSSNLNVFRYDVVAPQFKRLLQEGKLKQPGGPRTPYFIAVGDAGLRETPDQPEWESVERTALHLDTGEEYQIALPATDVVKDALLTYDYPSTGIRIRDIAEVLADQFELTEEQREAKRKHIWVWLHHVNTAAIGLVNSSQLLRIRRGWITNPEQYSKLSPSGPELGDNQYDVFISHATEDKDEIVRPLTEALDELGVRVWYDESELRVGDSLRGKIEEGLANSRYGIVVLSHAFFQKEWTKFELGALVTQEMADKTKILPIWHNITEDEIMDYNPGLTDKIALSTSDFTTDEIAQEIAEVILNARGPLSRGFR